MEEDVASVDTVKKNTDDAERNEPRMPDSCRGKQDRYMWRKWVCCWRELQQMNKKRKEELERDGRGDEYREDVMPEWNQAWKKRHGWMWRLDLDSYEEERNKLEEREYGKVHYGGRPPFVDYCSDNTEDWEDMSDAIQMYSDNDSYDSGNDYNSDF